MLCLAVMTLFQATPDWESRALQLEYEGLYDQAVIARIEAIRTSKSKEAEEQHRRELTRQLQWYEGLVSTVRGKVLHSDAAGGRIAVVDHELRVHDAYTGQRLFDPVPVEGSPWVTLAEGAPRAVLEGSDPRMVRVIELESGDCIFQRPIGDGECAISPDGLTLALAWSEEETGNVDFIDLASGVETRSTVDGPFVWGLNSLEFSPDGRSLLCTLGDFVLFDVADGTSIRVHGPPVNEDGGTPTREWINGGRQVAETCGAIGIWDLATAKWKVQGLWPGDTTEDVAFQAEEGILTAVGYTDVYRLSIKTGEIVGRPLLLDDLESGGYLATEYHRGLCSENGHLLAALGERGRVRVWDTRSGKKLSREFDHGPLRSGYSESEIELEFIDSKRFAAHVPVQFVRVWEAGDESSDVTDITEGFMDIAGHREPSPRCAVARRLARAFVYSTSAPARELPLPDGQYSGFAVTESGDRAYFGGEHYGVWDVPLANPDRPPRLVTERGGSWGIKASPGGGYVLLHDNSCTKVIHAATGVHTKRSMSLADRPLVLDDHGALHVYVEGSWKVADAAMFRGRWGHHFRDEIDESRAEPLALKPFHHAGTVTFKNWEEGDPFEATWTPETGEPITVSSDTRLWNDVDPESLLTSTAPPAFVLYDDERRTFTVHHLTTGKKSEIRWKAMWPDHVILGSDRLLVASEEEAVLFRISDGSVLALTPRLTKIKDVALIPGQDAFVVMVEQGCIDGFNALTGERVSPRWWGGAYSPSLWFDDGEIAIATSGQETYEYCYETGRARVVPSTPRPEPSDSLPSDSLPSDSLPSDSLPGDGPLLIGNGGWKLATVSNGQTTPGPTRRGTLRDSGAWLHGTSPHRFLNEEKTIALAGVAATTKGLHFYCLDFRPSQLCPTEGDVDALSDDWCCRLALDLVDGEIQPSR